MYPLRRELSRSCYESGCIVSLGSLVPFPVQGMIPPQDSWSIPPPRKYITQPEMDHSPQYHLTFLDSPGHASHDTVNHFILVLALDDHQLRFNMFVDLCGLAGSECIDHVPHSPPRSFIYPELLSSRMDEAIRFLFEIMRLPLLPYVLVSISVTYFGLAGALARIERKKQEAFFTPPPDIY